MKIGIDASRAFFEQRTGIEEYSFQVLKHLGDKLDNAQVVLYVRSGQFSATSDYLLPEKWKVKKIKWPFLWTQIGLSLELLFHPVDVLFVPSHVVPFVHPRRTIVTVHGLEYEFYSSGYSFRDRLYMRMSIKASCRWAKKIIAVSENTKKDLIELYKISEDKIKVIYEGYEFIPKLEKPNHKASYLLFIGRLEARKNVIGIIKAFDILKEKHKIPHQLILIGRPGYGYRDIRFGILNDKFREDIIEMGFVSDEQKKKLLSGAEVFLFPSFYEGFGLPILEAQSAGIPVVTSDNSSISEVSGNGALLVDPKSAEQIADAVFRLISDKILRDGIIKKGSDNLQRFSWSECGSEIAKILLK